MLYAAITPHQRSPVSSLIIPSFLGIKFVRILLTAALCLLIFKFSVAITTPQWAQ